MKRKYKITNNLQFRHGDEVQSVRIRGSEPCNPYAYTSMILQITCTARYNIISHMSYYEYIIVFYKIYVPRMLCDINYNQ